MWCSRRRFPMKGAVLTQLSQFWFDMMHDIVPNHLISSNVDDFPEDLKQVQRRAAHAQHAFGQS